MADAPPSPPVERRFSVLLVDDEESVRAVMARYFRAHGYHVTEAESVADARSRLEQASPDVAVLDYSLPDGDGITLLPDLSIRGVPTLFLTGRGSIDAAVRAIKEGAHQFLTKPVEMDALRLVVERIANGARAARRASASRLLAARAATPNPFQGECPAIVNLTEEARRIAAADLPVLIHGETGTGKGVLARWLHNTGSRSAEPFIDLNCAGLSKELLESELLGHERGAFSGATASKLGLLEVAHRGSLFLDEVGDMDLANQAKVLKVVEEQRFRRVGDVQERRVDVRLIAATHKDLRQLVADGIFRSDLYYRIAALPLVVPPLRERGRDVVLLAHEFVQATSRRLDRPIELSAEAEAAILRHDWPGNVRELRNAVERACVLGGRVLGAKHFFGGPDAQDSDQTLDAVVRRHVLSVLEKEGGDVVKAAETLGLSRSALYERLQKYGVTSGRKPKDEVAASRR
jgi:DNA-binding NtrC family response regulator